MSVDISKIKPGDEVTVLFTAGEPYRQPFIDRQDLTVTFGEGLNKVTFCVPASLVVSHTPRALKVGDVVRVPAHSDSVTGEVLAVDGQECWVRWRNGRRSTWGVDVVERVQS